MSKSGQRKLGLTFADLRLRSFGVISLMVMMFVTLGHAQVVLTSPVVMNPSWGDVKSLFTPEVISVLVFLIAGKITPGLTGLLKHWFKTEGATTERLNYIVSLVVAGLVPLALGGYGYTLSGMVYAVLISVLRAWTDQGNYKNKANQVARGLSSVHNDVTLLYPAASKESISSVLSTHTDTLRSRDEE